MAASSLFERTSLQASEFYVSILNLYLRGNDLLYVEIACYGGVKSKFTYNETIKNDSCNSTVSNGRITKYISGFVEY